MRMRRERERKRERKREREKESVFARMLLPPKTDSNDFGVFGKMRRKRKRKKGTCKAVNVVIFTDLMFRINRICKMFPANFLHLQEVFLN